MRATVGTHPAGRALQTHSTTQQKVEQAVAEKQRFAAQLASREADWSRRDNVAEQSKSAAEASVGKG